MNSDKGMIRYTVKRSDRRTKTIEVRTDGTVLVRVPRRCTDRQAAEFVRQNEAWIRKQLARRASEAEKADQDGLLTPEEIDALAEQALRVIPERVAYYAPLVGVTYGRITIRNQKTRWGSCSAKGNLNFNCLLMLTPPEVIDSVVVHELCHRKEMNHSKRFYEEVLRVYPDYPRWNRWLKENGGAILRRMTG